MFHIINKVVYLFWDEWVGKERVPVWEQIIKLFTLIVVNLFQINQPYYCLNMFTVCFFSIQNIKLANWSGSSSSTNEVQRITISAATGGLVFRLCLFEVCTGNNFCYQK